MKKVCRESPSLSCCIVLLFATSCLAPDFFFIFYIITVCNLPGNDDALLFFSFYSVGKPGCYPRTAVNATNLKLKLSRRPNVGYWKLMGLEPFLRCHRAVLGCVIPHAGAVARSRNLGHTFFANSVQFQSNIVTLLGEAKHSYAMCSG